MFPTRRRGEPLVVLGIVLIGWVGFRFTFLSLTALPQSPAFATQDEVQQNDLALKNVDRVTETPAHSAVMSDIDSLPVEESINLYPRSDDGLVARINLNEVSERVAAPILDTPRRDLWQNAPDEAPLPARAQRADESDQAAFDTHTTAVSHNLLWMAAMAYVPVPETVRHQLKQASAREAAEKVDLQSQPNVSERTDLSRFSVDSWLFLRQDGESLSPSGFTAPSYGRSQAGLVARYSLRPSSRFAPYAYGRLTQALAGPSDRDAALGLSAQPFPNVPVRAHVEARLSEQAGRTEIRPAAFITSGAEKRDLPLAARLSFYGQVGYVGGDFATGFVDGSLKVTRELAEFDLGSLSAGGGVWGGAQRGATRLDIGPSANLDLRLGDVPARLSVDYRVRVAGDARPGSGAAVTLSTGF